MEKSRNKSEELDKRCREVNRKEWKAPVLKKISTNTETEGVSGGTTDAGGLGS